MGIFHKEEPLTAATVRSFDRIPDRPVTTANLLDGDLWHIYRCVPEVHYAVNQQARLVGRLQWRIEIESRQVEKSDEILRQAFGADLRGLTVQAAIHLQVAGRFILARIGEGQDAYWKILNSPITSAQHELARSATLIVEVINEDPAIPGMADSPVRSTRDIAHELILTRAQARATARNRTAQTVTVLYPKEGAGPDPKKFEREWAKVVSEPLSDEKAGSVAIPNFVGWPAEMIDKWKVLDFTGKVDEKLHERVDKLIRQLAIGLDMAPSVLLGLEDSNQWSAYATLEDNWLGHVEPLAAPIGQALAEALAKAINLADPDVIEVIPDPAPLLRRRPAISDVLQAVQLGVVTVEWAAEQLGAPAEAIGKGLPEPNETIQVDDTRTDEPNLEQADQQRQITSGPENPQAAANGPTVTGERLASIDQQAYNSLEDLVMDTAERALEKIGARIRSMAQGRNIELPDDASNADIARLFQGEVPNSEQTIEQTAQDAAARVTRVVTRAQGQLRAMGVEVESDPEDPALSAAQEAFILAVVATVAAQQEGETGISQAWEAARQIATIAGGGEAGDFQRAASGIALAASTLSLLHRENGLAPTTGPRGWRWLHLYQGPNPHPVHLSLDDALFDGVSVFAGGFVAYPGDHPGCECIQVPSRFINVRTGWSQIQPNATSTQGVEAA